MDTPPVVTVLPFLVTPSNQTRSLGRSPRLLLVVDCLRTAASRRLRSAAPYGSADAESSTPSDGLVTTILLPTTALTTSSLPPVDAAVQCPSNRCRCSPTITQLNYVCRVEPEFVRRSPSDQTPIRHHDAKTPSSSMLPLIRSTDSVSRPSLSSCHSRPGLVSSIRSTPLPPYYELLAGVCCSRGR